LDETLARIFEALRAVIPHDMSGLMWADRPAGVLRTLIATGDHPMLARLRAWPIPLEGSLAGAIFETGQGELITDAQLDPRTAYPEGVDIGREHLICIPIKRGGLEGVYLVARHGEETFSGEDFELVRLFLNHAAIAVENARALDEARAARADAEVAVNELQAVLDAADSTIVVYNANGSLERANQRARERMPRLVGRVPDTFGELLAMVPSVDADGQPLDPQTFVRVLSAGEHISHVLVLRDLETGELQRTHAFASPIIDGRGQVRAVVLYARDITDLHEAIVERARLDGAVKTARRVAHELNNQLTPVAGYGEIVAQMVDGEAGELVARMAKAAQAAGQTLHQLQRIIRFEEVEFGGSVMLDLDRATRSGSTVPT
jgi:PAS domain-containing protein